MKISGDKNIMPEFKTPVGATEGKINKIIMDRVTLKGKKREPLLERDIPKLKDMAKDTKVKKFESYAPQDRFLWDSWIFVDKAGGEGLKETGSSQKGEVTYRLYHLDAPMSKDPDERHGKATIRQAVSADMKNWKDVGTALGSGPEGSWDDGPIWTGNVYQKDNGEYLLFYTGRNKRDGEMQRIGLARSKDGIHWDRPDKPLIEPDGRWYETTEPSPIIKAWRDPAVVKDEKTGKHYMYFTAKTKGGDERYKGCIGLAVADEIDGKYKALPPALAPGKFAQMEVPQVIMKNDKVYLFFNSMEKDYDPKWAKKVGGPQNGLHCYVGKSLTGPFEPLNGTGIVTGSKDNLYTVKFIEDPGRPGEYLAYGWYMEDKNDRKAMTLSQPMPVNWENDNIAIETGAGETGTSNFSLRGAASR